MSDVKPKISSNDERIISLLMDLADAIHKAAPLSSVSAHKLYSRDACLIAAATLVQP